MANNVDLMVVGAAEGISADELVGRLVAEFGQPAEAFADLIAAACHGGAKYAAQTGVTLDTAVEGQGKLEDLGIVCELVVDGEIVPSAGMRGSAPGVEPLATQIAEKPAEAAVEPAELEVSAGDGELTENTDAAGDVEQDEPEQEETADIELFAEAEQTDIVEDKAPASSSADAHQNVDDGLPAVNGLAEIEISFDDEIGALGDVTPTQKSADPTEDDLNSIEIDFADDAEEISKIELPAVEAVEADTADTIEIGLDLDDKADEDSQLAEDTAALAAESVEAAPASIEINDLADDPNADNSADIEEVAAETQKPVADTPELTLSVDDETPLTKPKKSGGVVPDIGGLSLLAEDELPASPAVIPDIKTEDSATDTSADTPVPESVAVEPAEAGDDSNSNAEDLPLQTEARDTSREPVEVETPVLAPDEAEPASDAPGNPEADKEQEKESSGNSIDSFISSTLKTDAEKSDAGADTSAEQQVASGASGGDDIINFIDSLVTEEAKTSGGLIMPGQVAEPEAEEPASENEPAPTVAVPVVSDAAVVVGASEKTEESYAPEIHGSGGISDEFIKRKRRRTLATAVAGIGAVGIGAMVALQLGFLPNPLSTSQVQTAAVVSVPAVAPQVQVRENAEASDELTAVEEVSLNAALERSEALKNPNNYSTEELIAYLSNGLGESARKELNNYVAGTNPDNDELPVPQLGAAIAADSDSDLWLRNRVEHPADKYFDEWSKREVELQAYLELQQRLIEKGDFDVALEVSKSTKDKLFAVMSQQQLARAFNAVGKRSEATDVLAMAVRGTYAIDSEAERVIAIADNAASEQVLGLVEDADDTFLKASILSRSLHKPETRTVAFSAIAEYFHKAQRTDDAAEFLDLAVTTAYELPVNTAARDLAIRHVALTEVRLGLVDQATEHANLIVDPFAAVSAFHGIALELERKGNQQKAHLMLNMAYRAGSLIRDSIKREKLLEKIQLARN